MDSARRHCSTPVSMRWGGGLSGVTRVRQTRPSSPSPRSESSPNIGDPVRHWLGSSGLASTAFWFSQPGLSAGAKMPNQLGSCPEAKRLVGVTGPCHTVVPTPVIWQRPCDCWCVSGLYMMFYPGADPRGNPGKLFGTALQQHSRYFGITRPLIS